MVRKHCKKLAVKQILSISLFIFDVLVFAILIFPELPNLESLVFSLIFSISYGYLLIFGAYMTLMNPEVDVEAMNITSYEFLCEICRIHVNNTTKHCGRCQICVSGFDHHCEWINNCIGDRNYKQFIVLILSLQLYELLFIFIKAYCLALYEYNLLIYMLIWVNLVENCIVVLANGFLLGFHAYLRSKNITTFDYIMNLKKSGQIIQEFVARTDPNFYKP